MPKSGWQTVKHVGCQFEELVLKLKGESEITHSPVHSHPPSSISAEPAFTFTPDYPSNVHKRLTLRDPITVLEGIAITGLGFSTFWQPIWIELIKIILHQITPPIGKSYSIHYLDTGDKYLNMYIDRLNAIRIVYA